jgi:hypothetical protein
MVRRSFRVGLRMGLLAGLAAAVVKTVQARRDRATGAGEAVPATWPPLETPPAAPPVADTPAAVVDEAVVPKLEVEAVTPAPVRKSGTKKAPAAKKAPRPAKAAKKGAAPATATAWVEPTGSVCPPSHPVKAKLSSRLFHLPGMFAYARTVPDRCYRSEGDAEADGLRKAKR